MTKDPHPGRGMPGWGSFRAPAGEAVRGSGRRWGDLAVDLAVEVLEQVERPAEVLVVHSVRGREVGDLLGAEPLRDREQRQRDELQEVAGHRAYDEGEEDVAGDGRDDAGDADGGEDVHGPHGREGRGRLEREGPVEAAHRHAAGVRGGPLGGAGAAALGAVAATVGPGATVGAGGAVGAGGGVGVGVGAAGVSAACGDDPTRPGSPATKDRTNTSASSDVASPHVRPRI